MIYKEPMEIEKLKQAIESECNASSVLRSVLAEVAELFCPEAYGFEGRETYPDCGECIVCLAKRIIREV